MLFGLAKMKGTPEEEIQLATRRGTHIPNAQAPSPNLMAHAQFAVLQKRHAQWEVRCAPCGIYNCFGLVWACRRTAIYDEEAISRIINEDGFERVQLESVKVGDVAVYRARDERNTLHVGVVVELRRLQYVLGQLGGGTPWVLSKLSGPLGEVLHHYQDLETDLWPAFEIAFLTERKDRVAHGS